MLFRLSRFCQLIAFCPWIFGWGHWMDPGFHWRVPDTKALMGTYNGVEAVQVPEAVLAADKIDDKQTCLYMARRVKKGYSSLKIISKFNISPWTWWPWQFLGNDAKEILQDCFSSSQGWHLIWLLWSPPTTRRVPIRQSWCTSCAIGPQGSQIHREAVKKLSRAWNVLEAHHSCLDCILTTGHDLRTSENLSYLSAELLGWFRESRRHILPHSNCVSHPTQPPHGGQSAQTHQNVLVILGCEVWQKLWFW